MAVSIVEYPGGQVAGVEYNGPLSGIPAAWQKFGKIAGEAGLFAQGGRGVTLVLKSPMLPPEGEIHLVASVEVPDANQPLPDGLQIAELPAGTYAKYVLEGSYEQLPQAWQTAIGEVKNLAGHTLSRRPCFEIYLNNMQNTATEDLRTELYIPVD